MKMKIVLLFVCMVLFPNTSNYVAAGPQDCGIGFLFLPKAEKICIAAFSVYSDCNVRASFAATHCSTQYTADTNKANLPADLLFAKCNKKTTADCCLAPQPSGGISLAQFEPETVETPEGSQVLRLLFNFVVRDRQTTFAYNVEGWEEKRIGDIRGQNVYTCDGYTRAAGSFYLDLPLDSDDDSDGQTMALTVEQEGTNGVAAWTGTFSVEEDGLVTTTHIISPTIASSGAFLISDIPFLFDDSTLSPTISFSPTLSPTLIPSGSPLSVAPSLSPSLSPSPVKSRAEIPVKAESEDEDGMLVIVAVGSIAAIAGLAVAGTVAKRKRSTDFGYNSNSASASPQSVTGGYPPEALRNSNFSVAADNPLRGDTISSSNTISRGMISSRFKSLFLPMWGDRANLGRSTIGHRNKVTSSKLLSIHQNEPMGTLQMHGFRTSFKSNTRNKINATSKE